MQRTQGSNRKDSSMTLQETVSHHLRASGESMRALSIRAGFGEKFVADLLCGRSRRPSAHNLAKLGDAIGVDLLSIPLAAAQAYGDLIARLEADPPPDWTTDRRAAVLLKLRWLVRRQNWDAATQVVDRRKIVEIFDRATPAALGLARGSKATYKSDILAGVDAARTPARARDVSDICNTLRSATPCPSRSHARWAFRCRRTCDATRACSTGPREVRRGISPTDQSAKPSPGAISDWPSCANRWRTT
jgi:hypothetical protein